MSFFEAALPMIMLEKCGYCGRIQNAVLPEGVPPDSECADCHKMEAQPMGAPLGTMN